MAHFKKNTFELIAALFQLLQEHNIDVKVIVAVAGLVAIGSELL